MNFINCTSTGQTLPRQFITNLGRSVGGEVFSKAGSFAP